MKGVDATMKKNFIWRILLVAGLCPFAFPFIMFVYQIMVSDAWTLIDWLIMYSVIYWPTYIGGTILTAISINRLKK